MIYEYIDDLNSEIKELSNKLDNALESVANGTMEISESSKLSREAGSRITEIAKDYAKLIKNKNSDES